MGLLGAALAAAPGLAHAQPLDLFYERTVMSAADARCHLFARQVGAGLAAGAAQARGAALRAGASPKALAELERDARAKAARTPCTSPDMLAAAAQVKIGFAGFAKLSRMSYPGDVATWRADRASGLWRLAQESTFGSDRMTFGLAGRDGSGVLIAVAQFADGSEPYAARLLLRNYARSSKPYLERWGSGPTAGLPLERRIPRGKALASYAAAARDPAGKYMLPKNARSGWVFRFPDAATQSLAQLDPREAVAVEFLFRGDVSRRAYVEVGDFAAGRTFLQIAAR
jgi:hypothetical protein